MKRSVRLLALLVVPVLAFALTACASSSGSGSAASASAESAAGANNPVPEAIATDPAPPVIVVKGTNEEMGYQYGTQVPDLIYRNMIMLKSRIEAQYGPELAHSDMQVWAYYADKYDPGLRGWLEGMQNGLADAGYNVDYYDLLMVTVYSAELWCRPPVDQPYPEETGIELPESAANAENSDEELHSCTAFAAEGKSSADGNPIIGVTKMITPEKVNSIILLAYPDEGYSFIANPMAGSVSENAGLNSAGYSWVFTAQWGPPIWGVINEVFFHSMVQNCASPEEAIELLETAPRAGVTGSFLMTAADGGIRAYESLSNVSATRVPGDTGEDGLYLAQTNHLVNKDLQEYNSVGFIDSSMNRYQTMIEYLKEAAADKGVSMATAKKAYYSDDWVDAKTGEWTRNDPGSESVNDNSESFAQAVFQPADMIAYFEVGTPNGVGFPGGATGEFVKFTLGDSPQAVSNAADATAEEYFWAARNAFVKMRNAGEEKLTYDAAADIEETLDVAATELELGMDRASFAFEAASNGQSVVDEMALWGEALTHYAKSQLNSQMATAKLDNLK